MICSNFFCGKEATNQIVDGSKAFCDIHTAKYQKKIDKNNKDLFIIREKKAFIIEQLLKSGETQEKIDEFIRNYKENKKY